MKQKELIAVLALSAILVVSAGINIYQYNQNKGVETVVLSNASQIEAFNDALSEKDSSLIDITNKGDELETAITELQTQIEEIQSSMTELQDANTELTEQIAQLEQECTSLEAKKTSSSSLSKKTNNSSSNGGTSQPSQPSTPNPAAGDPNPADFGWEDAGTMGDVPVTGTTGTVSEGYGGVY
jgi:peptidoglycan hydrolase CwlO-like protein